MSSWQVIQLAKPAGYADHKPPYDFKHGWVPVSGKAATEAAKDRAEFAKKTGVPADKLSKPPKAKSLDEISSPHDLTDEQLRRLPPNVARNKHDWPEPKWRDTVKRYLDSPNYDYSKTPAAEHEPPVTRADLTPSKPAAAPEAPTKKAPTPAKRAPRTKKAAAAPAAVSGDSTSELQRQAMADPDFDTDKLTPEWSSATRRSRALTPEETEATHLWQNGYTSAIADDEDEEGEAVGDVGLYKILNAQLRGTGEYDGLDLDEEEWDQIEQMRTGMESALAKSKTTRDVTVFRGVSNFGNVAVGDTVSDEGWAATSMNPQMAQTFRSGDILGAKQKSTARTLIISIPKGTNALAVREKPENEKYFGVKHEIVLGPQTPMRVTKIEGDQIHLEVVR